ncbi:histidine kinase [Salinisphaera orenii MK-B5]|uniref:histidine kinase n=1 Tax=Salinisphaera orenii MK-B5 TaxID=856730 RepID=A0A423PT72_9GAMM|nr:sensor histidine kinase [Salinisphaera orenii]ROO28731.1 histidine kinase [Salinisphaera orenii MK-B5]
MPRASLQRRLLLGAIAWILIALVATAVVLSLLFRGHLEDELARRLDADFLQLVSQLDTGTDGEFAPDPRLSDPLYERVFSGRYWQIDAAGDAPVDLRSRSLWDMRLPVPGQATGLHRLDGPRGARLLALTREVTLPRREGPLRLTVAASLAPVEAAVVDFRGTLAWALGALALGLIVAAGLQVGLGLAPLRRLRRELGTIRRAESARLSGDYPGEVAPLVADLNQVLTDNQALIERARHQAGNLAHALKTPLSVIRNEADRLAQEGGEARAGRLRAEATAMQRQIEWHLARTRIAATQRAGVAAEVAPVLERLTRTLQRLYGDRGRVIDTDAGHGLRFAGETRDLEQMIGNLMDNACKWARGIVEVRASAHGDRLQICVDDDGPGLPAARREQALDRGRRFDEDTPGWGLGLAIVADLARAYEGELALERAALGGLSARLVLPAG